MQISEMLQLTRWIKREIENAQIITKFDALYNILNTNATSRPNNQPLKPFEEQKVALINSITLININILSLPQINALNIFNIKENIGIHGKNKLNNLLENTLDIAHVAKEVNDMKNLIQVGITQSNQIGASLLAFDEGEEQDLDSNKILTRIIFEHEASIDDIKKLKDWSSKLFDIGRGFAIANGQTPEDIQVIGGARGSLIIELAILAATLLPLAKAINLTLDSMVKYKDYQLKAHEVRKLIKDTPKLKDEFEEDAKRWEQRALQLKKETAEEITDEIKQYFSNYKEENKAELGKSVRTLVDFISKGGDIDCVIPEDIEDEENVEDLNKTLKLLRKDFNYIRSLKETLFIEHDTE